MLSFCFRSSLYDRLLSRAYLGVGYRKPAVWHVHWRMMRSPVVAYVGMLDKSGSVPSPWQQGARSSSRKILFRDTGDTNKF